MSDRSCNHCIFKQMKRDLPAGQKLVIKYAQGWTEVYRIPAEREVEPTDKPAVHFLELSKSCAC